MMSFLFGQKVIFWEETIFVQMQGKEPKIGICTSAPPLPPLHISPPHPNSCHLSPENKRCSPKLVQWLFWLGNKTNKQTNKQKPQSPINELVSSSRMSGQEHSGEYFPFLQFLPHPQICWPRGWDGTLTGADSLWDLGPANLRITSQLQGFSVSLGFFPNFVAIPLGLSWKTPKIGQLFSI